MKIMVPLNDEKNVQSYIDAGADEFYLGFVDAKWTERFGEYTDINRMSGFKEFANKYNFDEACRVALSVKESGRDVFLTLNANVYTSEAEKYIESIYLPKIKEIGIDGIIVSDISVAKLIVTNDITAVASTMCAIYNSDIAKEYSKQGIKRIIIPRDVSLDEIEQICVKNPDIDFEVFFMRNGCIFSDSYCLGTHRREWGSFCGFSQRYTREICTDYSGFNEHHAIEANDYIYNFSFHHNACGMCSLFRLKRAGVKSLKIVGRADSSDGVIKDIRLTRQNIEILEQCQNEKDYLDKMVFPDGFSEHCLYGLSCYYPEVRF